MKGQVKFFSAPKGYGFITPEDGGKDVFVHHTAIKMEGYRSLSEGDKVEFEKTTDEKGTKAIDVRKI